MAGITTYAKRLATAPAAEPVTLEEAKLHLRVDHDDEDDYIAGLVTAAREMVERLTGRQLVAATWDFVYARFPCGGWGELYLPAAPVQSVTSVSYVDGDGDAQTVDADAWELSAASEPAIIRPAVGYTWPATADTLEAVTVRAVCGYGDADDVPQSLRRAVLLIVGHWYTNREAVVVGTIATSLPAGLEWILQPFTLADEFLCYGPGD